MISASFLSPVAIGMISPGPVVITATIVGYLFAGFLGSLVSTIGIFLPSFILVLIAAPILARHRGNPNVQGVVKVLTARQSERSSGNASCLAASRDGAHAPPPAFAGVVLPNFHTGIPSFLALSAKLS